jgi:RNA polymerase sigma factor (TIGR02999 family)
LRIFEATHVTMRGMRSEPITQLLHELAKGESPSDDRIVATVVKALERIAEHEMALRGGWHGLTLEPQVFAHDALLKILDQRQAFANRGHFFVYATQIMVRAMIDYHRARHSQKRGGDWQRISLTDANPALQWDGLDANLDVERMPPALEALHALDARKANGVRLRVFWGATTDEIGTVLGLSSASVERDWRFAKRWLAVHLREQAQ